MKTPNSTTDTQRNAETNVCTIAGLARYTDISEDTMLARGFRDAGKGSKPFIEIPYYNDKGDETATQRRHSLSKDGKKDNRFTWEKGDKPQLYGQERLKQSDQKILWAVEGVTDCLVLEEAGRTSVGRPGAHFWNQDEMVEICKRFGQVLVTIETDSGGENTLEILKRQVAGTELEKKIHLVFGSDMTLKGEEDNDLGDLRSASPKAFRKKLTLIEKEAESLTDFLKQQKLERQRAFQSIIDSDDVVGNYINAIHKSGYAGEDDNLRAVILASVTIMGDRPVNPILKGAPSIGKSEMMERVLWLTPDEFVERSTASTPLAIVYTEKDLSHKIIYLAEMEALDQKDSRAISIIRSLISQGYILYWGVQDGKPVLIIKQGPIGFWSTTNNIFINEALDSRILSLFGDDSVKQNLDAINSAVDQEAAEDDSIFRLDPEPFKALFSYIFDEKIEIWIPWARKLVDSAPELRYHPRIRRDIKAALALIKADAKLNHTKLEFHEGKGAYVADHTTYQHVLPVLETLFAYALNTSVPDEIRETVELAERLLKHPGVLSLTKQDLLKHLDIKADSTIGARVKKAIAAGYLRDERSRRNQKHQLVMGDVPLPTNATVLPTVDELFDNVTALRSLFGIEVHADVDDDDGYLVVDDAVLDAPTANCDNCQAFKYYKDQDGSWKCGACNPPMVELEMVCGINSEGKYLVEEPF